MIIDYSKIGQRIATRRRELNLKQCQLAKRTRLSSNHISNIEKGRTIPSIKTIAKICQALNVTPDFVLLGSIRVQNIPKNLQDNLLLCNENTLLFINEFIEFVIFNQKN